MNYNKFLPESIQYEIGSYLIPNIHNIYISKNFYKGLLTNKDYHNCFICNKLKKCIFVNYYEKIYMCIKCSKKNICFNCDNLINIFENDISNNISNNVSNNKNNNIINKLCERCSIYNSHFDNDNDFDIEEYYINYVL
jgi:hypothetical protein